MKSNKRWFLSFVATWIIFLAILGGSTVVIDPFFHYHTPLDGLEYDMENQRYINDGIVKHFDYDAIITGSSMTENFKASELDALFGTNSIKVSFSGGTYKEVNDNLAVALEHNPDVRLVVRGIDGRLFDADKDTMFQGMDTYPLYLYDNFLFNDVEYIFNKAVFVNSTWDTLMYTRTGGKTPNFDEYSNWNDSATFGKAAVDASYARQEEKFDTVAITEEDYAIIRGTITQNVTDLVAQYPDVQFYLFFPPYSIYYWDNESQFGLIEKRLAEEKYIIELLLEYDNIHLFSFNTEYETVCDLDSYMDIWHYDEDVNSQILVWMREGKHELTKENYLEYCEEEYNFYMNYDYDALFQ